MSKYRGDPDMSMALSNSRTDNSSWPVSHCSTLSVFNGKSAAPSAPVMLSGLRTFQRTA